jgi:hypothetical protein
MRPISLLSLVPYVFFLMVFALACCALFKNRTFRISFKIPGASFSLEAEGRKDTIPRLTSDNASSGGFENPASILPGFALVDQLADAADLLGRGRPASQAPGSGSSRQT